MATIGDGLQEVLGRGGIFGKMILLWRQWRVYFNYAWHDSVGIRMRSNHILAYIEPRTKQHSVVLGARVVLTSAKDAKSLSMLERPMSVSNEHNLPCNFLQPLNMSKATLQYFQGTEERTSHRRVDVMSGNVGRTAA